MKLIDVLIKLYKGEIKNGTTITVNDKQYKILKFVERYGVKEEVEDNEDY